MKWWLKYLYIPGMSAINWLVVNFINIDVAPNEKKVEEVFKRGLEFYIDRKRI